MNDRENDRMKETEGQQVQRELEDQLREFGDTMSDAFRYGFEGRGMEIGDRAWDVGKAAVHAANFGISEAGKALRNSRNEYYKAQQEAQKTGPQNAGGMPQWARQIFGLKGEQTPVDLLRADGKKRQNGGAALLAVGITFMVIFGLGTLGCLIGLGVVSLDVVVSTAEGGGILMTGTDYVMNTAYNALGIVGSALALVTAGFGWMTACGSAWVKAGKQLGQFADLADTAYNALGIVGSALALVTAGFGWMTACGSAWVKAGKQLGQFADLADTTDYHKGLSVRMLADLVHQNRKKMLKKLQKYIRKGWLNGWLDEKTETLYLTAEDYRAAQEARAAVQAEPEPKAEPQAEPQETPLNLETTRRFAKVLAQEQQLMQDAQGVEELAHMQKTTEAICDWLEAHPESLPKARRFAEYYIPTTLKLLHTYNDVQGQKGDNAESIRRDIAGILHTLNQAYDNLYDNLLSDVALDVSSEIAALQGMLANDGLTGEGLR